MTETAPNTDTPKKKRVRKQKSDPTRRSKPIMANGGWWADPVKRAAIEAKLVEGRRLGGKATAGLPKGWLRSDWEFHFANRRKQAEKIVTYMESQNMVVEPEGLTEEERAFGREALVTSVTIMREREISAKDRLTAAKLVMDYTRQKPTARQDVRLSTAEDWLASVADEAGI